ncbi:MAG: SDR family NAD(P)-dependent oxidoreductase [Fusobacteriaceae bacterium]
MNNLRGKLVMITGASNGIGKATAIQYAEMEANLILMGRNEKALTELKEYIMKRSSVEVYTIAADVRDFRSLREKIENLPADLKKIDILVNNAGLAIGMDKVYLNEAEDMANVVDTNIKGVLHMIQLVVPLMLEHGRGHIVNMGSVAGNAAYAGGAVYCGTKAAVKTISDGLRIDLVDKPVKVTTILPGMVETEFSIVRFKGDTERAANVYKGIEALTPEDVAGTIIYVTNLPKNVQITDLTLTPLYQADGRTVHKIIQ